MKHSFLIIFTAAIFLQSCSPNPVTGRTELTFVSPATEIELGSAQFQAMQQKEGGLYTAHPEINDYVKRVGMKLAAVCDRPDLPFDFVVLDNDIPNAWTLPGGKVAINRGLLAELQSEAELAAVLSHEIVHAAARHGAQNVERGLFMVGGLLAVDAASKEKKYHDALLGASAVGAQLVMLKYSRSAELEADAYGITYMVRAGYDPNAAVKLQETFLRLADGKDPHWLEGLFLTHPPTQERLEANRANAKRFPPGGYNGQEEYKKVMKPLKKPKKS